MTAITNLLLFLGNHFYFVLIGCAELILTVVLLGILPRRQSVSPRAKLRSTGAERMLIPELARRSDNVCVALRRQDLMTVIAAGNMENILGIKLDALQDDLSLLLDCLDERQAGLVFWQNYRDWNGKTPLQTDLPFKGGEWLRVAVQRSLDQDYPTLENQMKILNAQRYHDPLGDLRPMTNAQNILEIQNYLSSVRVVDAVLAYAIRLCEATRTHPLVELGISPRGISALVKMSRASAVLRERNYVVPEDVQAIFTDVCAHRLVLRPQARVDGVSARALLREILTTVRPESEARR